MALEGSLPWLGTGTVIEKKRMDLNLVLRQRIRRRVPKEGALERFVARVCVQFVRRHRQASADIVGIKIGIGGPTDHGGAIRGEIQLSGSGVGKLANLDRLVQLFDVPQSLRAVLAQGGQLLAV